MDKGTTILICLGGHALTGTASLAVLFVGHLCGVLFFFGSAGLIVKSLFNSRSLTFDSIFGAVCGYLFLGIAWAMSCLMIETFQPGSFQISQPLRTSGEQPQPHVLMYYSFVTLTTVGYGDVTPISPTTRTFAWIQDGKIRVEWLNPAAPGVDSKWEMRLYGLVRTGKREEAMRFLQETRRMPRNEASRRVSEIAGELGIG